MSKLESATAIDAEALSCQATWKNAAKWFRVFNFIAFFFLVIDAAVCNSRPYLSKCAIQSHSDDLKFDRAAMNTLSFHLSLCLLCTMGHFSSSIAARRASKGKPVFMGSKLRYATWLSLLVLTTNIASTSSFRPSFCLCGASAWFVPWLWLAPTSLFSLILFWISWLGYVFVLLAYHVFPFVRDELRERQQAKTDAPVSADCKNLEKFIVAVDAVPESPVH